VSVEIVMETERLLLRNYRAEDVAEYVALSADPEIMRWLGGVRDAARAAAEVAELQEAFAARGWAILAVERKTDGAFVGISGLSVEQWYPADIQIGWRLFRQYWGQGYATEAAVAWRDRAFEMLMVPRLLSISDVPNIRSHRLMERLGMRFDHVTALTDGDEQFEAKIYVLDAADWRVR
jgi:RimJ/RimL family protein N-acetyltransferase